MTISAISFYLKREFELDDNDIKEMLEEFISNVDSLLTKAENELAAKDLENLKKTGHSIKGAAANIGATEISALGKSLELGASTLSAQECTDIINGMRKLNDSLKAEFKG